MQLRISPPAWLFSFVDLAFLLLIAVIQISSDKAPEFGDIVIPRIHESSTGDLPHGAAERSQLRIHPPDTLDSPVFELFVSQASVGAKQERADRSTLRKRLDVLRAGGYERPLIAPHENSLSRDMLHAIAILEEFWPKRRRVTVASGPGPK